MNHYSKIRKINAALLRRYGKGILTFLNIFWGIILLILMSTLLESVKTTSPVIVKQVISFFIMIFIFGDLASILLTINVETVLSLSILNLYPVSHVRKLQLPFYYFFVHSRLLIYLLPALYIIYFFYGSSLSFFVLFLTSVIVLYMFTTAVITAIFYLTEAVKYKYGKKSLNWFIVPFLLLGALGNNSTVIYNNFLTDFLFNMLRQFTV